MVENVPEDVTRTNTFITFVRDIVLDIRMGLSNNVRF